MSVAFQVSGAKQEAQMLYMWLLDERSPISITEGIFQTDSIQESSKASFNFEFESPWTKPASANSIYLDV